AHHDESENENGREDRPVDAEFSELLHGVSLGAGQHSDASEESGPQLEIAIVESGLGEKGARRRIDGAAGHGNHAAKLESGIRIDLRLDALAFVDESEVGLANPKPQLQ